MYGTAKILSTPNQNAYNPKIAMDSDRNIIAIWTESGVVKSKTKLDSKAWGDMESVTSSNATSLHLFMDPGGKATALWLDSGLVKVSSKTLAGSWSTPTTLSSSGASSPSMAGNSDEDIVTVWERSGNIESSTKLSAGSWPTIPSVIESTSATAPDVALGDDGTVVAVWHRPNASVNQVYTAGKMIGGTWSAEEAISDISHECINAKTAVNSTGKAYAVWYRYDLSGSSYSELYVQLSHKGSTSWETALDISTGPFKIRVGKANPANYMAVPCIDNLGNILVGWSLSLNGDMATLGISHQSPTESLPHVIHLITSLYLPSFHLAFCRLGSGYNQLIYPIFDPQTSILSIDLKICALQDLMEHLMHHITLSTENENANPDVTENIGTNDVKIAAAWECYSEGYSQIQADIILQPRLPIPTNLSVTQSTGPFHLFAEYYNTFSWQCTSSPILEGFCISRDGHLLATVDATTTEYIDHNRIPGETTTYKITSQDQYGIQSSQATVTYP